MHYKNSILNVSYRYSIIISLRSDTLPINNCSCGLRPYSGDEEKFSFERRSPGEVSSSFESVKPQADQIAIVASTFECVQALLSNKRVVYCFVDMVQAIQFRRNIPKAMFNSYIQQGRNTNRTYVQVDFNYPY